MSRVIIFNDYLKSSTSKGHILESIDYIASREGVELNEITDFNKEFRNPLHPSTANKKVTDNQEMIIKNILAKFPDLKEDLPYEEFFKKKNMYTASLFITESMEYLEELAFANEDYVMYISQRPGVEVNKDKAHGLFNETGDADLAEVKNELLHHEGNVWRSIISLRRSDAAALDYESQKSWKDMINKHIPSLAKNMKIQEKNFRWCAAFHNESYHPHIHMMYWSSEEKEGFCDKETISSLKSDIANDIFSNEIWLHKEFKTEIRKDLETEFREKYIKDFNERMDPVQKKVMNKIPGEIVTDLKVLANKIPNNGSHYYSYQTKDIKDAVDLVVAKILADPTMQPLFNEYIAAQKSIASFYLKDESINMKNYVSNFIQQTIHPSKNDRKVFHNMVLKEVYALKQQEFLKYIMLDPMINTISRSLDDKLQIIRQPKNLECAVKSVYKFKLFMGATPDIAVDTAAQLIPNEEKRLELFLELKTEESDQYNFSFKDWKALCSMYQINFKQEVYIPVDRSLYSCTKLVQGIVNLITNDTNSNVVEAQRLRHVRRVDEMLLKKSKLQNK